MNRRYFTDEQVMAWVAGSCDRQGVPVVVSDRAALAKVAALGLKGQAKGKRNVA